jgi:hypothetical protein
MMTAVTRGHIFRFGSGKLTFTFTLICQLNVNVTQRLAMEADERGRMDHPLGGLEPVFPRSVISPNLM